MYVTRRLSMYKKDLTLASLPPPDGTNTGILVIQDENYEFITCCRVGFCNCANYDFDGSLSHPFPQNKPLVQYEHSNIMAIPVINEPLSARRYYMIFWGTKSNEGRPLTSRKPGKSAFNHQGTEFDPSNKYQQFYLKRKKDHYQVKSLASDGIVPDCMRKLPSVYDQGIFPLDDVNGLDHSLRGCLPKFNFPVSQETSDAVIVGKWYCPYLFVHETNSYLMFYEMTLKQQWVRIFSCSNSDDFVTGDSVAVDVNVETEVIDVLGMGTCCRRKVIGGKTWYTALDKEGVAASVGLDRVIIEKIIGDQESFGWVREKDKVKKVEKFEGKSGEWKKFGCYVLVERYVLRGRNRRLVLTYEFRHTHKIRCKWE